MLYIRSFTVYRPSWEGSQHWKESYSENSELDFKSQRDKTRKPPEYIHRIQQIYYLERGCRF
ncbi:MAG: hypothetical protein HC836_22565 [Richelia sp. RM2_1_2]|nr:hypothetical protein [Richelia sp. SM1_7_0]NJN10392.1 hypothetical protein [Richelia sp. RM1_1_1]NJO60933.1 hypothetical protein [Richelia sp. RM2_1_2]NJS16329.1 hypothetical protein [Nostocaceae cyanobacterium CSU_2_110]